MSGGLIAVLHTFLKEHHELIKDQMSRLKAMEKQGKNDSEKIEPVVDGDKKKRTKKKTVDPDAPKKPESAYILFVKDRMNSVKEKNPEVKQNELFSLIATQWNALDSKSKEGYNNRAATSKAVYANELESYISKRNSDHADDDILEVVPIITKVSLWFKRYLNGRTHLKSHPLPAC